MLGSLELYSLTSSSNASDIVPADLSSRLYSTYKNRQSAARSKLLSVASHGTRIVYSDAEGNVKWIERDGRVEVRRWNINSDRPQAGAPVTDTENEETQGATGLWSSLSADSPDINEVARKVLPTDGNLTEDELLLWTGDRIGCLRFSQQAELEEKEEEEESDDVSIDEEVDNSAREEARQRRRHRRQQENEYAGIMRKTLERQADEVRWMGRLGLA
ncbi:F-box domain-containing protein [Aspergillus sp. HF37]|nr:F-box domain-containing protein [Aspergillus sp. HF37]